MTALWPPDNHMPLTANPFGPDNPVDAARYGRISPGRATICGLALWTVFITAGCGTRPDQRPATSGPPRSPTVSEPANTPNYPGLGSWSVSSVKDSSAEAVLVGVADTIYTYASAIDRSSREGFDRARGLLSQQYQQDVEATQTGLARYTATTWQRWAQMHAIVAATAAVTADDHPPDTAIRHARVLVVTQSVHPTPNSTATDRELEPRPSPIVLYMTATRPNPASGWRVSMISAR